MTLSDYCTVTRQDGKLVITIPEEMILKEVGTEEIPFVKVIDPERVLNHVAGRIRHTEHEHQNHETNLDHLVREALRSAVDDSEGIAVLLQTPR